MEILKSTVTTGMSFNIMVHTTTNHHQLYFKVHQECQRHFEKEKKNKDRTVDDINA